MLNKLSKSVGEGQRGGNSAQVEAADIPSSEAENEQLMQEIRESIKAAGGGSGRKSKKKFKEGRKSDGEED